eukprot:m.336404 g.336404  ORF g.336404 m.336404 type:complete len:654 (-) comp17844_c0_seq1:69-2030(-)
MKNMIAVLSVSVVLMTIATGSPTPNSKLSIHSGMGSQSWQFVQQAQPRVIKLLDVFGNVPLQIKKLSPQTLIVGRIYLPSQPMDGDPVQRAQEWWAKNNATILATDSVDFWEGYNEPACDATSMTWLAAFEVERINILSANGRKASIGNFGTGNPDVTTPSILSAFDPAIRAAIAHGGILGLHEYSSPTLDNPKCFDNSTGEGWMTMRYRKYYREHLIPNNLTIHLVVSEFGIDNAASCGSPDLGGWRKYCNYWDTPNIDDCAAYYLEQMKWYDSLIMEDDYFLGATIYQLEISGWEDYSIAGSFVDKLIAYINSTIPTPTPTPSSNRPYLFGIGVTWGEWLGLNTTAAYHFNDISMAAIKAAGGTATGLSFNWAQVEAEEGKYDWSQCDAQVALAEKYGLVGFAYTGLTPDWALTPSILSKYGSGIGYRFPPDPKFTSRFSKFFTSLSARYKGRVKFYEFWNEENGCGWIEDGCKNSGNSGTYIPWLKTWYQAMKSGDASATLAIGGFDCGMPGGDACADYLSAVYSNGGKDYFDAVPLHPYGSPLNYDAVTKVRAVLVANNDSHKPIWINEYGWNTQDETMKSEQLTAVLESLQNSSFSYVEMANYLILDDLPNTPDSGHDFGLMNRNKSLVSLSPRLSYYTYCNITGAKC